MKFSPSAKKELIKHLRVLARPNYAPYFGETRHESAKKAIQVLSDSGRLKGLKHSLVSKSIGECIIYINGEFIA